MSSPELGQSKLVQCKHMHAERSCLCTQVPEAGKSFVQEQQAEQVLVGNIADEQEQLALQV